LSDFSLIPPPDDELKAQKQRWKDQLDLEKTITESLYQKIKQRYYQDLMPKEKAQAPTEKIRSVSSEILDKVRAAYADAYALKAFREVLGPELQPQQQAQQVAQPAEEEKKSVFLQSWMKWAEKDQEKAMQFLNSLSEEQISKLAYLDTKEDAGLARILPMISGGKSTISDILSVINQLPKAPSPQEYMDTAIQLSDKLTPKPQTDNEYVKILKEQVDEIKRMNAMLQEELHKRELEEKDKEIENYRQTIERLEQKIPTAEQLADWMERKEKEHEEWAQKRGYVKATETGKSKDKEDREFLQDMTDTVLSHLDPLVDAYAKKLEQTISQGGAKAAGATRRLLCSCGTALTIPWPIPEGYSTKCPKCGEVWEQKRPNQPPKQAEEKPPPEGPPKGFQAGRRGSYVT